jgi:hypothetical protein
MIAIPIEHIGWMQRIVEPRYSGLCRQVHLWTGASYIHENAEAQTVPGLASCACASDALTPEEA